MTVYEADVWHNAAGTLPLAETLPWSTVGMALSDFMQEMTGKCLSKEQLQSLDCKLGVQSDITRQQFSKALMKGRAYPFWQWFYELAKLIRENFPKIWQDG